MQINLLEYIEKTVTEVPGKVAFADENSAYTFSLLYEKARAVGSFLCGKKLYKRPVVVFMDRSPAVTAAFFGVLYAGCYYVPLDAEMPAFRIQLILETVKPGFIICDESTLNTVTELGYGENAALYEGASACAVDDAALTSVRSRATDTDPAYIVFTSGSTGIPKGVIASHRSVINYIEQLTEILRVDRSTVFGNQVPLYVDACLKELYPTVKCGATTYLIPKSLFMFPVKLIEYINAHRINTICWVASALTIVSSFGALDKSVPETLRTVAFGSEVFPPKQFNKWRETLPDARFVHLYGQTEATGMQTWYEAKETVAPDGVIPIGKPFKNMEVILLDEEGNVPPDGQPGEICMRGAGLSLGYFGDEEKTRKAFVQNPLSGFPDVIYKTGDIAYRNGDGNLVFQSRKDHQIKHMGHRIELAEIEWAASRCDGVRMACAVFDGEKSRIVLYCVADEDVTARDVTEYCKKNLPRYMVPYAVIPLEQIPLTSNGKMDRVELLDRYVSSR